MEIRSFAIRVLESARIEQKLAPFVLPITDDSPGEPVRPALPARAPELVFAPRKTAPAMPKAESFIDPARRAIAHHIMANHELQALEVMAFTLVAFPDAPAEFRRGMLAVMADEQRHTRMHIERAAAMGLEFGSQPVNGYFWQKAQDFESVLDYIAGLPLTFEGCNLDHTLEFEQAFAAAGDLRSAAVMRTIHRDEIRHVQFGLEWLRRLKPENLSEWDTYVTHLHWPLRPAKAKGKTFVRAPREAAGMSPEFLEQLENLEPEQG